MYSLMKHCIDKLDRKPITSEEWLRLSIEKSISQRIFVKYFSISRSGIVVALIRSQKSLISAKRLTVSPIDRDCTDLALAAKQTWKSGSNFSRLIAAGVTSDGLTKPCLLSNCATIRCRLASCLTQILFFKILLQNSKSHFQNTFTKLKKAIFKILLQNSKKSFSKHFWQTQKSISRFLKNYFILNQLSYIL